MKRRLADLIDDFHAIECDMRSELCELPRAGCECVCDPGERETIDLYIMAIGMK